MPTDRVRFFLLYLSVLQTSSDSNSFSLEFNLENEPDLIELDTDRILRDPESIY